MRYLETLEARVVAVISLFLCLLLISILAFVLINTEGHVAEQARLIFLTTLIIVSGMALGLLLLLQRSVFAPLYEIAHFAKTLAQGELNCRTQIKTTDEIGQLAEALNMMATRLQAREETIEEDRRALDLSNRQLLALIQEMHHRIKNNLQSIASLLELEMLERCPSPEAQDCLQKSVNRVKSIAAVHQLLSEQSTSFTNVKDLARSLATITARSLVEPGKEVIISVRGPEIYLNSHKATSLALILNELLSNAVKHGLAKRHSGSIDIAFTTDARGVTIVVKDDGVGLPAGFDMANSVHLGLQIARNLAESDLGGSLTLYSDCGTKAMVFFPE
jgi:two-component sensor histidine kinase